MPISRTVVKGFMVVPPNTSRAAITKSVVSVVLMVLGNVWFRERLVISLMPFSGYSFIFSRILSKITMVSFIE